jgi:hypothetical protein
MVIASGWMAGVRGDPMPKARRCVNIPGCGKNCVVVNDGHEFNLVNVVDFAGDGS